MLNTETLSSFQKGEYLTVEHLGQRHDQGDEPQSEHQRGRQRDLLRRQADHRPTASAAFVGTDTTTQGSWHGVYGADGYDIAADTSAPTRSSPPTPRSASSAPRPTRWTTNTTDARALQNAAGTGRIESAWYTSTSMSFNLDITDGKVHEVSLYAADLDSHGRSEEVQVIDAATGTVLDTETLSSFTGGEYLSWNVSGNVVIKVTNLNPKANAVVSGLFFD